MGSGDVVGTETRIAPKEMARLFVVDKWDGGVEDFEAIDVGFGIVLIIGSIVSFSLLGSSLFNCDDCMHSPLPFLSL